MAKICPNCTRSNSNYRTTCKLCQTPLPPTVVAQGKERSNFTLIATVLFLPIAINLATYISIAEHMSTFYVKYIIDLGQFLAQDLFPKLIGSSIPFVMGFAVIHSLRDNHRGWVPFLLILLSILFFVYQRNLLVSNYPVP